MEGLSNEEGLAITTEALGACFPDLEDAAAVLNQTAVDAVRHLATVTAMHDTLYRIGALSVDEDGNYVLDEKGYPVVNEEAAALGVADMEARAYEAEQMADANEREIP
jgi:hypothetical protein